LVMLLTGSRAIRDVLLFPHMRPPGRAEAEVEESEPPARLPDSSAEGRP
jgi:aspartyl-tRNA synthetase